MSLDGFHLRVAQVALDALKQEGFALGGGYALQAYGIVDRDSDDLDAYSSVMDVGTFERAEALIVAAVSAAGLDATVGKSDSFFRQVFVTDPISNETVVVDLGWDARHEPPVIVSGVGPVLSLAEAIGAKARALNDRRAARDYVDIDRVLQLPDWTPERLYEALLRFRVASREEFAADLRAAHEQDPDDYGAYGMSLTDMDAMFERLERASIEVAAGPGTGSDLGEGSA